MKSSSATGSPAPTPAAPSSTWRAPCASGSCAVSSSKPRSCPSSTSRRSTPFSPVPGAAAALACVDLDDWRAVPAGVRLRSHLEARLLSMLAARGLPIPLCNQRLTVNGRRIEAGLFWPDQRLVIETDDRETHDTAVAFERDRVRDADLAVAGYRSIRVTDTQIKNEPEATMQRIAKLLRSAVP